MQQPIVTESRVWVFGLLGLSHHAVVGSFDKRVKDENVVKYEAWTSRRNS